MKYSLLSLLLLWLIMSCQPEESTTLYPKTDLSKSSLIPIPANINPTYSAFGLDAKTSIQPGENSEEWRAIGNFLSKNIKWKTNLDIPIRSSNTSGKVIYLQQTDQLDMDSPEAYILKINNDSLVLQSATPEGAFRGIQTISQLIPEVSNDTLTDQPMWLIPSGTLSDAPQFAYRGAMLDVARHFFTLEEVKKFIDILAYYKYNKFHIHLTDDQGWRLEIKSWPKLTDIGASSEVGGGPGGFYTQEEFKELVAYAAKRYIEIIPEIDMPGHTNAASLSYPFLNGNGKELKVHTGMEVGFSTFDTRKDTVYAFIDDVVREISAISPSSFFHIGGDESHVTQKEDYVYFVNKVEKIVNKYDKRMIGWDEIATADINSSSVVQLWNAPDNALLGVEKGCKVLLSPAKKIYLDMQYDSLSAYGLHWAAYIPVDTAYNWNPATYVEGIEASDILGIEAPLWSETISNSAELEYLAFPRAIGYAELGWSPASKHDWEDYVVRLKAQEPYLKRRNVNFYRTGLVQWSDKN